MIERRLPWKISQTLSVRIPGIIPKNIVGEISD